jgi:hypothetical protein
VFVVLRQIQVAAIGGVAGKLCKTMGWSDQIIASKPSLCDPSHKGEIRMALQQSVHIRWGLESARGVPSMPGCRARRVESLRGTYSLRHTKRISWDVVSCQSYHLSRKSYS